MRAAAEVLEGTVAVEGDGLRTLVANQVLDQLDLVVLALLAKELSGLLGGDVTSLERLVGLDVLSHPLLDPRQILLTGAPVGELDVVVEAVLDRRSDGDLGAGPEVEDGLGEDVRSVVANQLERLRTAVGDDLDRLPAGERCREVAQLAVDLDRQRRPGEARADRGSGVRARRAGVQLEIGAVGQVHLDLLGGGHRG
jgi:hypothetical protein